MHGRGAAAKGSDDTEQGTWFKPTIDIYPTRAPASREKFPREHHNAFYAGNS